MTRTVPATVVGLILSLPLVAGSPVAIASQLRSLQSEIDLGHPPPLPVSLEIETAEGRYTISTEPARRLLAAGAREEASAWLSQVAKHLEAYSAAPPPGPNERAQLTAILSQSEFASIGPPSRWEQLREQINAWMMNRARSLFAFAAAHPTASNLLFWTVLACAVGVLMLTLFRYWTRDERLASLPRPNASAEPARRRSEEWLREARQAADAGDARQAIHAVYWAGVSRLRETGILGEDIARTPREQLRLLSVAHLREPLSGLTSALERFWYGGQSATLDDFRESLRRLEALGWKL